MLLSPGALLLDKKGLVDIFSSLLRKKKLLKPLNWRNKILKLYPSGDAPLTRMIKEGKLKPIKDPKFSWYGNDLS